MSAPSNDPPARSGDDVFLSYSWRDHQDVEVVARALKERGVSVFLDRWYLKPGRSWQDVLEEKTRTCGAVAVFVGPEGLGRWQQREAQLALVRQAGEETFPVIPVLLPGAEPPLGFLELNTWVDLGSGVDDAVQLEVLAGAIRGEAPGEDVRERVFGTICPYRGLSPFREEDAAFFFGRKAFTEQLVAKVAESPFVAVVGASGSGKSSVVRAGLLPVLRADEERAWEIVTLVPGDRPLRALAAALLPVLEPDLGGYELVKKTDEVERDLAGDSKDALRNVVEGALRAQPGTDRLLIFVDQWEEVYTLCEDDEVRKRFVDQLLAASETGPLTVVLTMRGDFYGEALGHRGLGWRMQDATVNLGPMRREELEPAVERPAEKVGLRFQDGLVDRILDAVGDEPGNLPLLEFVLADLWKARRGDLLHHDAYDAMGELEGAMATRADEVYGRLTQEQQEIARRVVRRLVRLGEGKETRQRVRLDTMDARTREVVDHLARDRLLVTGRDEDRKEETLEVAHEALIRHWHRLQRWVDEDRELLLWKQRLRPFVEEWERDPAAVLRGRVLEEAEGWIGERADAVEEDERALVEASAGARKRKRVKGIAAGVVGLLAVTAVGFLGSYTRGLAVDRLEFDRIAVGTSLPRGWVASLPDLFADSLDRADRHRRIAEASYGLEDLAARDRATPRRALDLRDEVREVFLASLDASHQPPSPDRDVTLNQRIEIPGGTLTREVGEDTVPVTISTFRLQQHEVTNEEYERFDPEHRAGASSDCSGGDRHPVRCVTWYDAMAYAAWLGGTLPTEAQWEFAARGEEGREYPWGPEGLTCERAVSTACGQLSTPDTVMSRPAGATPEGVHDLAGNVWEWASDWFGEYDPADDDDPRGSPIGSSRVLRGGSFFGVASFLRGSARGSRGPGDVNVNYGFRVAWPGGQ